MVLCLCSFPQTVVPGQKDVHGGFCLATRPDKVLFRFISSSHATLESAALTAIRPSDVKVCFNDTDASQLCLSMRSQPTACIPYRSRPSITDSAEVLDSMEGMSKHP